MPHIQIHNAYKRFPNGFEALKGVSVDIEAGSFTVILGPSGAGKSTLLRLMNGLETPTSGSVHVNGIEVTPRHHRRMRTGVGMIFQQFNLVGRLMVMTNVLTGRLAHRSWLGSLLYLFRQDDLDIAHEALARVGLTDKAWDRADRLSGGQQQRVAIARALAQKPRAMLADEPVASLDPVTSEEILSLLKEISQRDGITVVVNLHQVDLAKRFADRVIGLNAGRLIFDGAPEALTRDRLAAIYQREGMEHDPQLEAVLAYA
jgi:phosphonate transport system ATP-binding protein